MSVIKPPGPLIYVNFTAFIHKSTVVRKEIKQMTMHTNYRVANCIKNKFHNFLDLKT